MSEATLEQMKRLATHLSRSERVDLASWLEATLDHQGAALPAPASRSLYGLCADLGPGPTEEDLDELRREMWANFPREDIA